MQNSCKRWAGLLLGLSIINMGGVDKYSGAAFPITFIFHYRLFRIWGVALRLGVLGG